MTASSSPPGAVTRVARQLGIGPESLRNWLKQAEIDQGKRPGVIAEQQRRIAELEHEKRELWRANEKRLAEIAVNGADGQVDALAPNFLPRQFTPLAWIEQRCRAH